MCFRILPMRLDGERLLIKRDRVLIIDQTCAPEHDFQLEEAGCLALVARRLCFARLGRNGHRCRRPRVTTCDLYGTKR